MAKRSVKMAGAVVTGAWSKPMTLSQAAGVLGLGNRAMRSLIKGVREAAKEAGRVDPVQRPARIHWLFDLREPAFSRLEE